MPRERRPAPARRPAASTSWDPLAYWYNGWVGEGGSEHHRLTAIPAVIQLLKPLSGERILDVGCGQGVLASAITGAGAHYLGVDASPRMVALAKKQHTGKARFVVGDARKLDSIEAVDSAPFDSVVFLLSLQDMDPLEPVLAAAGRVLRPNGRLVLLLTHPAFRVPRQSGWGWDEDRKLIYRRVDRYLTPLPVPMKAHPGRDNTATTRSFHRPIGEYINVLADQHLYVDRMDEIPAHKLTRSGTTPRAESMARQEIPLFLAVRACKLSGES